MIFGIQAVRPIFDFRKCRTMKIADAGSPPHEAVQAIEASISSGARDAFYLVNELATQLDF